MNIIAIDPAVNKTGVFYTDGGREYQYLITTPTKDPFSAKLVNTFKAINIIVNNMRMDLCLIEAPYPGLKTGQDQLLRIAGVIELAMAMAGVPVVRVPIPVWKSVTGMNKINKKEDPDKYLLKINTDHTQEFKSIDIADAYMLYVCYQEILAADELTQAGEKLKKQFFNIGIDCKKCSREKECWYHNIPKKKATSCHNFEPKRGK